MKPLTGEPGGLVLCVGVTTQGRGKEDDVYNDMYKEDDVYNVKWKNLSLHKVYF